MSLSESNKIYLQFLKDIYEVSEACSSRTFIWGGTTIDILEGHFLREHHDIDGFTLNLLDVRKQMTQRFESKGYEVDYMDEVDILGIKKDGLHAGFNRLEVNQDTAMWRAGGDEGTVYFPWQWLNRGPIEFYDARVYISGVEFEYTIKTYPKMLHPNWDTRDKDREAIAYLTNYIEEQNINKEAFLKQIWSYSPYWSKRGHLEYAMPFVAWPLEPKV